MILYIVIGLQFVVILAQMFWINRLINKLMSRNFYDYAVTQQVTQPQKSKEKLQTVGQSEEIEDLNYLGAIN